MVSRTTHRRPFRPIGPVVLTLLVFASLQQLPPTASVIASQPATAEPGGSCCTCCGGDCRCTGDCCADSHAPTVVAPRSPSGSERPAVAPAAVMKRHKNCQKAVLFPAASTKFQASLNPTSVEGPISPPPVPLTLVAAVCRWQRPAVSCSTPRAPPSDSGHPLHS
jgi:hypothetical protein